MPHVNTRHYSLLLLLIICVLQNCTGDSAPSSGLLLVRISSLENPQGRDAAGSCCNPDPRDGEEGVCSQPCYTMLRICATKVTNESVLVVHGSGPDQIYTVPGPGRGDSTERTRLPGPGRGDSSERTRLPPPSPPPSTPSPPPPPPPPPPPIPNNVRREGSGGGIVGELLKLLPGHSPASNERTTPNHWPSDRRHNSANNRPTGSLPDHWAGGPPSRDQTRGPTRGHQPEPFQYYEAANFPFQRPPNNRRVNTRPQSRPDIQVHRKKLRPPRVESVEGGRRVLPPVSNQYENTLFDNAEYSVIWRRDGRTLLKPSRECEYGSLTTEVLFNNTLTGQGDLLVKLPFQESWKGVFHLTIEAWHVHKPKKIPQPVPPQKKNSEGKSVFERILENLANQLKENILKDDKKDDNEKEEDTAENENDTTTLEPDTTDGTTGINSESATESLFSDTDGLESKEQLVQNEVSGVEEKEESETERE